MVILSIVQQYARKTKPHSLYKMRKFYLWD